MICEKLFVLGSSENRKDSWEYSIKMLRISKNAREMCNFAVEDSYKEKIAR